MITKRNMFATLGALGALGAVGLALPLIVPVQAQVAGGIASASGEPVLIELFTSQGCSSCPPADRLAARLASNPDLVVIARPVTYWDQLGWKDTLAREDNTDLQRAYARAGLAGRNGVYTPQVVIDGAFGAIGSHEADIRTGVARFGGQGKAAIRVNDRGGEGIKVGIGGDTATPADLVLIAVTRKVEVGIGRGENSGRAVTYTNVLREERRIASWQGGKASHVIAADQLMTKGADRYALVLRQPDGGKVLAARWLDQ